MNSWHLQTLDALCSTITVGHVSTMAGEYTSNGIPFLRSKNVRTGRLDLTDLVYVSEEFHQNLKKSQLHANDIVIVRTGTPGAAALIPKDFGESNCSDIIIARPSIQTSPRFLCYAINATARDFVSAHTVGAVQQHFNIGSARKLQIHTPPLQEQEAIADVLCALDDKITINEIISTTSIDLGRSILQKSVQLETREASVSEFATLIYGKALPEPKRRAGSIPVFGCTGQVGWHSAPLTETPCPVVGRKGANAGHVSWMPEPGWVIDTAYYAIPATSEISVQALHFILDAAGFKSLLGDSAVPGVNRNQALSLRTRIPGPAQMLHFNDLARDLLAMSVRAEAESRTIAELRDTLLPQLVTGKIRVKDAERIVEDAT